MGLYDGITGLVTQPVKGAQKEGVVGALKGFGKGIGGIVLKPSAGMSKQTVPPQNFPSSCVHLVLRGNGMVNSSPLLQLHAVSPATPSKVSTRACRTCVARTCKIPLLQPMRPRGWRIGRDHHPKSGRRLLGGGDQGELV